MDKSPHSIPNPKIDPSRRRPDNTPDDDDRVEIGPTPLAYAEWAEAGLECPDLPQMRQFRLQRLVDHIVERDWAGVLLFDPLNIRYATDTTHMQLWNTHNPFRAVLVTADGHMVLWEYGGLAYLSEYNPLVAEVRTGASFFYFATGERTEEKAELFAQQVNDLLRERCGGNRRLGIDKIQIAGLRALEGLGIVVEEGEELTERARTVKGPDEIKAMRCAMHACEQSIAEMRAVCEPGVTENDVWAELHASNIRRGGEWIETRILASGPRTNPWFQECGPRVVQNNEIVAFDTDLIGAYGICIDISRTWWIGDQRPSDAMVYAMRHGVEHIQVNMQMLKPGAFIPDIIRNCHRLDDRYQKLKYGCFMHGVGLCDEWPLIVYPDQYVEGSYDYELEPGMTLCVEALITPEGGDFSIKLEDQVLITDGGFELLTQYPYDPMLMGNA